MANLLSIGHGIKKIFCIMLAILLCFFVVMHDYQEARAFFPAILLVGAIPEAIIIVGSILVAMGVMYTADTLIDLAVDKFLQGASTLRSTINSIAETYDGEKVSIDDTQWNAVRSAVRAQYSPTTTNVSYPKLQVGGGNYTLSLNSDVVIPATNNQITYTSGGVTYVLTMNELNGTLWIYLNGSRSGTGIAFETGYTYKLYAFYQYGYMHAAIAKCTADGKVIATSPSWQRTADIASTTEVIPVTCSTTLADPAYDFETAEGKREVGVPTSISGLANKTAADVQNPTAEVPGTGEGAATEVTQLGILAAISQMAGNIARFFDLTKPVNLEPLKVAGNLFTNAFPFSLPWDLTRSFTTLSADAVQPSFDINVPDTKLLKGFRCTVNMDIFQDLFKFVRTAELIGFDIGLVLLTRRLLGGAV